MDSMVCANLDLGVTFFFRDVCPQRCLLTNFDFWVVLLKTLDHGQCLPSSSPSAVSSLVYRWD